MSVKVLSHPDYPIFEVPLANIPSPSNRSLILKVAHVVKEIFVSINTARREIQKDLIPSFTATVLKSFNVWALPLEPAVYAFRIIMWAAQNTYLFGETVFVDLYCKLFDSPLKIALDKNLDPRHIRTSQGSFDVSTVPADTTIDTLMALFDKINFTDENSPYFVDPKRFPHFDPENTRRGLSEFIQNVTHRVPRLGTPSAEKVSELEKFYEYIEGGVRLILQEFVKQTENFYKKHGTDPTQYSPDQKNEHQRLLEERVQLAIEFTTFAYACGSRYTSETVQLWKTYCNQNPKGDLENQLIETLASLRADIASKRIDALGNSDAHFNNTYMVALAKKLGLPGQAGTTEALPFPGFNESTEIREFYRLYTPEIIIELIQQKIKDPHQSEFRALIVDWVKAKRGNWMPWSKDTQQKLTEVLHRELSNIIEDKTVNSSPHQSPQAKHAENALELIIHLKDSNFEFPDTLNNWDDFIKDLFAKDCVKEWCNKKFDVTDADTPILQKTLKLMRERNALKNYFLIDLIGKRRELLESLIQQKSMTENDHQNYLRTCTQDGIIHQKIHRILEVLKTHDIQQPELVVLERIVSQQTSLEEGIRNLLNAEAEAKFVELLKLDELEKSGLSDELLKLLFVEHHVLTPSKPLEKGPYPLWKRVCLIKIPKILTNDRVVFIANCVGFVAHILFKCAQIAIIFGLQSAIPLVFAGFTITALATKALPIIAEIHQIAMIWLAFRYLRINNGRSIIFNWAIIEATVFEPFLYEIFAFSLNTTMAESFWSRIEHIKNHLKGIAESAERDYRNSLQTA